MLKEYADGNSIEVEVMYGTTEIVNLNSKLFFLVIQHLILKLTGEYLIDINNFLLILHLKNIIQKIILKHYNLNKIIHY